MTEKDFENAADGMDYEAILDGKTYRLSVSVSKSRGEYNVILNGETVRSGYPMFACGFFAVRVWYDGHDFLLVIRQARKHGTRYLFDCFADGISVGDGSTTLSEYRRKKLRFLWARSLKDALCHPFFTLATVLGIYMFFFLESGGETLSAHLLKAFQATVRAFVFASIICVVWDFSSYILLRKRLAEWFSDFEDKGGNI